MSGQIDPRIWAEVLRWLAYVDQDIRVVEILMAESLPNFGPAAFHCQQAVEKMAKALLVAHGADVPKIHDVDELSSLLSDVDVEASEAVKGLVGVSSWYTAVRYPNVEADYVPTADDVRRVLPPLRQLREYIDSLAPKA